MTKIEERLITYIIDKSGAYTLKCGGMLPVAQWVIDRERVIVADFDDYCNEVSLEIVPIEQFILDHSNVFEDLEDGDKDKKRWHEWVEALASEGGK